MNEQTDKQQKGALVLSERQVEFTPFASDQKLKITIGTVQHFIATRTKLGHMCSERDAMKFLMLCQARGLNPWEGDAFLVGYDTKNGPVFTIITAHQAFLKRAEVNPEYDGMESGVVVRTEAGGLEEHQGDFVDESETLVGGWAKVHFKNRKYPIFRKIHLNCFWPEFPSPLWEKNAAGMICKVAEADALRSSFPTKCGGMYLQQETEMAGSLGTLQPPKQMPEGSMGMLSEGNGSNAMPQFAPEPEKAHATNGTTMTPPEPRQSSPEASPQEKLKVFVEQEGFSWEIFSIWAEGTGNQPEGANWKSFDDIPDELAKRILSARSGLKKGMTAAKGAVTQ